MPPMERADHLHVWRQGHGIEDARLDQWIVGSKEDMTGDGNLRYKRGSTALAVVVERIPKTTLRCCVAFVESIERELGGEHSGGQVRKTRMPIGHVGAQEPGEVFVIEAIGWLGQPA